VDELVFLEVPAGDPHGHGGLSGWDDHPHAGMAATPHGPSSCVDHETDQKPKERVSTFVRNVCMYFNQFHSSLELAGILRWGFVCFIMFCSFLYPLIRFEFKCCFFKDAFKSNSYFSYFTFG
jgi:hypothetical protein